MVTFWFQSKLCVKWLFCHNCIGILNQIQSQVKYNSQNKKYHQDAIDRAVKKVIWYNCSYKHLIHFKMTWCLSTRRINAFPLSAGRMSWSQIKVNLTFGMRNILFLICRCLVKTYPMRSKSCRRYSWRKSRSVSRCLQGMHLTCHTQGLLC